MEINGIDCYGVVDHYTDHVVIVSQLIDGTEVIYDVDNNYFWCSWEECVESIEKDFKDEDATILSIHAAKE